MGVAIPIETRFYRYVRPGDGCWAWAGTHTPDGYARLGSFGRTLMVHRLAYEMLVGPIPDGLQLDHLCRNRGCVNPAHLEPVTNQVNVLRGVSPAAVNAAKDSCSRGHPFTADNLIRRRSGARECKACNRERQRRSTAVGGPHQCAFCPAGFPTAIGRSGHEVRLHRDEVTADHRLARRRAASRASSRRHQAARLARELTKEG